MSRARSLRASGVLVGWTIQVLFGCGKAAEKNDSPGPSSPGPSGLTAPAQTTHSPGAAAASSVSLPTSAGTRIVLPVCGLEAVGSTSEKAPTVKENLAKAPPEVFSKVRVGQGTQYIAQPTNLPTLFEQMTAPLGVDAAQFVACQVQPTTRVASGETLELTVQLGDAPVFTSREALFGVAGKSVSASRGIRITAAVSTSDCTWGIPSLLVPVPQKTCVDSKRPIGSVSTAPRFTFPVRLVDKGFTAECRALDAAAVDKESAGARGALQMGFTELCAAVAIDPTGRTWGSAGGSSTDKLWSEQFEKAGSVLGFADSRLVQYRERHDALSTQWSAAFGDWVKRMASDLPVGGKVNGDAGARYQVVSPLECSAWPFSPADPVPLGMELPKGHKACWFTLEVGNARDSNLTVKDSAGAFTIGGNATEFRLATARGDLPNLYFRGVENGKEMRYVVQVNKDVAPGGSVRLIFTTFVTDAVARSKEPILLGADLNALLRVR